MERFSELPCEARMLVTRCTPHPVSLLLEAALERFSWKHRAYVHAHSEAVRCKRNRMFEDYIAHHNWTVRRRRNEARGDVFDAKDLCQWAWYECEDWDDYDNWRARSRSPRSSGNRSASRV